MLTSYLRAAMHQARYEIVEDDGSFYGEIPAIRGIWANAQTLEACREELESVLEGWVLLSIADHSPIPEIDGNRLEIREVAPCTGLRAACLRRRSSLHDGAWHKASDPESPCGGHKPWPAEISRY